MKPASSIVALPALAQMPALGSTYTVIYQNQRRSAGAQPSRSCAANGAVNLASLSKTLARNHKSCTSVAATKGTSPWLRARANSHHRLPPVGASQLGPGLGQASLLVRPTAPAPYGGAARSHRVLKRGEPPHPRMMLKAPIVRSTCLPASRAQPASIRPWLHRGRFCYVFVTNFFTIDAFRSGLVCRFA